LARACARAAGAVDRAAHHDEALLSGAERSRTARVRRRRVRRLCRSPDRQGPSAADSFELGRNRRGRRRQRGPEPGAHSGLRPDGSCDCNGRRLHAPLRRHGLARPARLPRVLPVAACSDARARGSRAYRAREAARCTAGGGACADGGVPAGLARPGLLLAGRAAAIAPALAYPGTMIVLAAILVASTSLHVTTVLVTASGAPGTAALLRALRLNGERGVRIVGTDMSPQAVGRHFCDRFYVVPPGDDPAFSDAMLDVVRRENIDAVLPQSSH